MVAQLIMVRIKFPKGKQRTFIKNVLEKTNCPSLRSLILRGFDIPYSTLKCYYTEKRFIPEDLFERLCILARIDKEKLSFELLNENWGQVKGGKKKKSNNGPAQN